MTSIRVTERSLKLTMGGGVFLLCLEGICYGNGPRHREVLQNPPLEIPAVTSARRTFRPTFGWPMVICSEVMSHAGSCSPEI